MTARGWLALGTASTALGILIAATAPVLGTPGSGRTRPQESVGGVLLVLGWALLAWAIHSFGRSER